MKKLKSLIFGLLLMLIMPVYAHAEIFSHKIYANSPQEIEAVKMVKDNILKFKAIDEYKLTKYISVEKDSIITVRVKEYVAPKRGKIDGCLKIYVDSYTIPSEDNKEVDVKDYNIAGTLKNKVNYDKKEIAEAAGISAAEYALDATGITQVYYAAKGLIKPNEGQTRLQSAGTNVYNSTGLQYIGKGQDLVIKEDSVVEIAVKSEQNIENQ